MIKALDYFREFNILSVMLRLILAMAFGGMIGLERERKHRPAGFRTYMLVCIGAALTMILSQYEHVMLTTEWVKQAQETGVKMDFSRFGAQVINGIGFLGAGTVLVTRKQEVKGLTTAAGLWASACMGLAIGVGFYECVILAVVLIFIVVHLLPLIENYIVEKSKIIDIYMEFQSLDDIGKILTHIKAQGVTIYEMDIDHGREEKSRMPSAVFSIYLNQKQVHTKFLAALSELEEICLLEEI